MPFSSSTGFGSSRSSTPRRPSSQPFYSFYGFQTWNPDTHVRFPDLPATHPNWALQQTYNHHIALYARINKKYARLQSLYFSLLADVRGDILRYGITVYIVSAILDDTSTPRSSSSSSSSAHSGARHDGRIRGKWFAELVSANNVLQTCQHRIAVGLLDRLDALLEMAGGLLSKARESAAAAEDMVRALATEDGRWREAYAALCRRGAAQERWAQHARRERRMMMVRAWEEVYRLLDAKVHPAVAVEKVRGEWMERWRREEEEEKGYKGRR